MEWVSIDYAGTTISATDFLNGVLVYVEGDIAFVPGYYVQAQLGDMDGPALRPRTIKKQKFVILAEED